MRPHEATCETAPDWLAIAHLVMELGRLAQSGQPSLVKIDELREHGKIYTVKLDGPANESGSDLMVLMRAAARFHDDSAIARQ
ncbi:hypothetical protein [Luteibacter jiangsuensis]